MVTVSEIREQLRRLLSDELSLREFSDWFVPHTWNAELDSDPKASEFAESIDDLLVEFDGDCPELRQALLEAWFSEQEQPPFFANRYGEPTSSSESNAELFSQPTVA